MTHIDFILLVPEFFQLVLINIFLLYALFFSSLGKTSGGISSTTYNPLTYNQKAKSQVTEKKNFRTAYLPTPLQIVEPLTWLIVMSLLFSSILYGNAPVNSAIILTNSFICDDYGSLFKILLCLASAAAIALALPSIKSAAIGTRSSNSYEFILIVYLAIMGMLALISSYNFLTLYLSIELQSLCFYMLACMKARSEFSAEAGLKYFILGAFSSAILLFGICLIYGSVGSIYFDDIAALLHFFEVSTPFSTTQYPSSGISHTQSISPYITQYVGLTLGLICVCISLLFKLAAAPFHAWAPDVYEGSPIHITAFFAITAKIAALAVLVRLVVNAGDALTNILSLVAIASLIVGTLSAMRQVKIKRLIAFSGIANVGWFLMGVCCGGFDAIILHLIVYIILSITIFSILIQPIQRMSGGKSSSAANLSENMTIKHISDLGQVYKTNPMVALSLTIALFSLGGIPILAGFYSKYLIINSTIQTEEFGLLTVGIISAVFSAFYYIRVIKTLYFAEASSDSFSLEAPTTTNAYMIATTTLFTLMFIVYPESLSIWLIHNSM